MRAISTLACLALTVAAVPQDGSPKSKLYVCQGGHCVVNSGGLLLSECEDVCVASPGIVQLAASVPDLSTLVTALKAGNLTGALSGPGPFTVFAPTNEAFSALPPATLKSLLDPENIKQLQAVLEYHVAAGSAVYSKDFKNHERIKTLEGESVEITLQDGAVFVDRSRVVKTDNDASNGVVHIIDKVLQPLGPPPPSPAPPPSPLPPAPAPGLQDILDLAESVGDLSFLSTVLKGSGGSVRKALSGRGPFTVFAPTNGVFASLPYPYAASLVDPANLTDVQKLLGFHVVPGIYYPENLADGLQIKTLEGDPLEVVHFNSRDWQTEGTYIGKPPPRPLDIAGDVKLTGWHTLPPVNASNGVVYLISGLLVPPGANPIPPRDHTTGNPFEQQNILRGCTNKSCVFSFTNKLGGCCGEVDAAPRMPPGIWNDSSAVVEYVRLTTVFSSTVPNMLPPFEPCISKLGCPTHEFLSLGSCTGDEFHQRWVQDGNRSIDWSAGFVNWCRARCGCGGEGHRPCKHVRDDPATHHYCSLCGPKYNAPIDVQLYHPKGGSSAKCLGV